MPFYNVICNTCGKKFEYLERSISNPEGPPLCDREDCSKENIVRDYSNQSTAVHYKGAGFYKNDYAKVTDRIKHLAKDDDAHGYVQQAANSDI